MKFGIFYEISVPRPWDREQEKRVFDRCLELAAQHQAASFVLAGDLNTGNQLADRSEGAGKYYCSDHFDRLTSAGGLSDLWRLTNGDCREWTWLSPQKKNGFRIDHAFGNGAFVAAAAPICTYDHRARETATARLWFKSATPPGSRGGRPEKAQRVVP